MKTRLPVVMTLVVALSLSAIAAAYTTYAPLWSIRLSSTGNIPGDSADAVDANRSYVFALSTFTDTSQKSKNVTVSVIDPSNGNVVNAIDIYGKGLNLTGWDIGVRQSPYVYIGLTFINTANKKLGGIIAALYKGNLSIKASATIYDSSEVKDYTIFGICRDASGNVYGTGYIHNPNTKTYNMSIIVTPEDLQNVDIYYISYTSYGYNSTGISCAYGYDGHVYFVGQLFYNNFRYPSHVFIIKYDPSTNSIAGEKYIGLWNSDHYVTSADMLDADIAANDTAIALAIGYTDDLPDVTTPSTAGAVIVLDHSLEIKYRKNLTTSYDEELDAVAMAGNGSVLAAGQTVYDYGTGLGTTYYKSIALILGKGGSLSKAILYGATDADSEVSSALIAPDGSLYLTSNHYSDTETYYDITADVTLQNIQAPVKPPPADRAIKVDELPPLSQPTICKVEPSPQSAISISAKPSSPGAKVTPSGGSSALLVKLVEALPPPPPLPETHLIIAAIAAATAVGIYAVRRRRA